MPSKLPPLLLTGIKFEQEFVDFVSSEPTKTSSPLKADDVLGAGFYASEAASQRGFEISEDHFRASIGNSLSRGEDLQRQSLGEAHQAEDEMYLFQRMKSFVRKQQQEAEIGADSNQYVAGFNLALYTIVKKPLTFMRNLTIPISEESNWDRSMAKFTPPIAFLMVILCTESKPSF